MRKKFIGCLALLLWLCGCATKPTDPEALKIYEQNNDPFEPMNRAIFGFNQGAYDYVLTPTVKGYRAVVPDTVKAGIENVLTNLKQPIYMINALLQGDLKATGTIAGRFALNSVFGVAGIFDLASREEMPVIQRDFGQTLAVWGVKNSGPYIMLPIIGPTTLRDGIGMGVDAFADPVDWALYNQSPWWAYGRAGVDGFVQFENKHDLLENMKKTSTDYYATMRSMYQQNRQKGVNELRGEPEVVREAYDFDFPDDEEE
ncbi:MAG: VacJ family lipoprotein [Pseudomonadota bacterium]|nr:VacJ family lipoprotein [Pseudomonadota bacterium]